MSNIAVTIPMFSRTKKLETLLDSIDLTGIEQVYVADNGKNTSEKKSLYSKSYSFDFHVFDLEFDSGVGKCRQVLSQKPDEEFLYFLDPDMKIPTNYQLLIDQIRTNDSIGAISGLILEGDRIYTTASDIKKRNEVIHRDIWTEKQTEVLAGAPLIRFDFIPQVGVFRKACFDDYTWDDFYRTQREHVDFFMGHKDTRWEFAICPSVYFPHYPGGSAEYKSHRQSKKKRTESHEYFCRKWDCEDFRTDCGAWIDTYPYYKNKNKTQTKIERLREIYDEDGAVSSVNAVGSYLSRRATKITSNLNRFS